MTFFYDNFWLEPGSRLTGTWLWPWRSSGNTAEVDLVVLISHVTLGENQDGSLEYDFMCSHLPWAFGGIHGVGPGGDPWLMIAQIAPANISLAVNAENQWWAMIDSIQRALTFNNEAEMSEDLGLSVADLHAAYRDSGVSGKDIADWTVPELVSGLLAQATNMPLQQIVDGRSKQCAFPDSEHACEYDVFKDVFAGWTHGLISVPDFDAQDFDESGEEEDDDGDSESSEAETEVMAQVKQRVDLETAHSWGTSWSCVVTWTAGVLHVAHCDYSDNDDTSHGFDIDQPEELLTWLIMDTFDSDETAFREYLAASDISFSETAGEVDLLVDQINLSLILTERARQDLTLALIRDRCQGKDAMNRVRELLVQANVSSTKRDRGYV